MPSVSPQLGLTPSLLDRLLFPASAGTTARPGYNIDQMIDAVVRDVEDLLNTRRLPLSVLDQSEALASSPLGYGMPDITSFQAANAEQRAEIGRAVERAIERFEPRLRKVRAILVDPMQDQVWHLRFRIEAELAVDPHPLVAVETMLELAGGRHRLQRIGE